MDSTHKTNTWHWRLFTLTVRDRHGCYIPAAQFLVEREDSMSVGEALKALRVECLSWEPLYFVLDDSMVEQNGILAAFPAPYTPKIFLCTVHTMRTWRRQIADKTLISLLVAALHKTTAPGCQIALEKALAHADTLPQPPPRPARRGRDGEMKPENARLHPSRYLRETVIPKSYMWGMHGRQMVPALLQMATTNAAESYHRLLKRGRFGRQLRRAGVEQLFSHGYLRQCEEIP